MISKNDKEIGKIRKLIESLRINIEGYESRINSINSSIRNSTGIEQEKLNREIANLRADLAGMNVNIDNNENKISEISNQITEVQKSITEHENSIRKLKKEPVLGRKQKDIELKKHELEKLEEQRKKFYMFKSELKSIKQIISDKTSLKQNYFNESDFLIKQIEQISTELFDKNSDEKKLNLLKISTKEKSQLLEESNKRQTKLENISYTNSYEVEKQEKMKNKISKMDICPICKSKVTAEHVKIVNKEAEEKITYLETEIVKSNKEAYIFEYEMKTSHKKQQKTIEKIKKKDKLKS